VTPLMTACTSSCRRMTQRPRRLSGKRYNAGKKRQTKTASASRAFTRSLADNCPLHVLQRQRVRGQVVRREHGLAAGGVDPAEPP
jgi:hypothetical protein